MDFVQWLRDQLDEDERIARAAMRLPGGVPGEQWRVSGSHSDAGGTYWSITNASSDIDRVPTLEMVGSGMSGGGAHTEDVATHIAAHDPARVLREIEAKRKLLDDYEITARIRDEAAARIKAAGDHPDSKDLETWDRAEREVAILEGPVRLLALPYSDRPGYKAEEWAP